MKLGKQTLQYFMTMPCYTWGTLSKMVPGLMIAGDAGDSLLFHLNGRSQGTGWGSVQQATPRGHPFLFLTPQHLPMFGEFPCYKFPPFTTEARCPLSQSPLQLEWKHGFHQSDCLFQTLPWKLVPSIMAAAVIQLPGASVVDGVVERPGGWRCKVRRAHYGVGDAAAAPVPWCEFRDCSWWSLKAWFSPLVLVCYCCCNKWPQSWWVKTTEIYSLTVLEARSSKSRCWQGQAPSVGSRGELGLCFFQLLVAVGNPWLMAPSLQSASLVMWSSPFSVSSLPVVSNLCFVLVRTLVIGFRAHLDNPEWSYLKILNLIASAKTFPKSGHIHGFQGLEHGCVFLQDTIQSTVPPPGDPVSSQITFYIYLFLKIF